jgi:hypothetical protein
MKFELVINLKRAKQIGFTIPPECAGKSGRGDQMTEVGDQRSARGEEQMEFNAWTSHAIVRGSGNALPTRGLSALSLI